MRKQVKGDITIPTKVFLVDDEVEFASTLSERLRLRKYDARPIYNAEDALHIIRSDPPDVILLDLKMPGTRGIDMLRTIKEIDPTIEVIIITGKLDGESEIEGMESGAFAYIVKPIDIDELIVQIDKAKMKRNKG
jgi:two-component system response regulator CpxR